MTQTIHLRIKHLLEETNDAFTSSGAVNIDYAGFAAMAISDFKHLLDKPDLTDMELRRMIRKASHQHRSTQPESCWATFIAHYVTHNANQNYGISGSSSHVDA
ncbi:MAG: hypothetical protein H6861_02925 [Rhodospirillales bacterium]|nr:hypothetical protein [Rhodospirillales bacterium]